MKKRTDLCVAAVALLALAGCAEATPEDVSLTTEELSAKKLDLGLCDPSLDFTLDSTNPYFPITMGRHWVLEGEEDDEALRVEITALRETEVVAGVTTRVVEEREWADDELVEVSRNFLAETLAGTVCYFGEEVDDYEDGEIVGHEGAWRADEPGHFPGIMMPFAPHPGMKFQTEGAPGIAEDQFKIIGFGPIEVPAGHFTETIRVREYNPLEGDKGYKVFVEDVGLAIDETIELVSY